MQSSGFGVGLSWATTAWGADFLRFDPYSTFNFAVELEGLLIGGFTEASGLESQVETEDYQEGGVNNYVHQFPKQTKQTNIVLKRGMTGISTMWNWYYDVTQGIIERKSGTIMMLDRKLIPITWWNFHNAYPVKWTGPTFKADSDEVGFESLELVHEGISQPLLAQALALSQQFF